MAEFPKFTKIMKSGEIEIRRPELTWENVLLTYEAVDRNREYLGEFLGWVSDVKSPEDRFLWVKNSAEGDGDYFIYVDGKFAGTIGLVHYYPEEKKRWCEIGYWMDKNFAGRGVMTRAVKILENAIFKIGEINRIQIKCDDANIASARVAEKAGYKLEGVLRQAGKSGTKASGDIRVYSKLRSEWEESKNGSV